MRREKRPFLSVVIPAYNESVNFRRGCLNPLVDYLQKRRFSWEVIFVDDGSTDDTGKLLNNFARGHRGFRYLLIPHGGKLAAVYAGVFNSKGEIVLFTDFDQSTPIDSFEKMEPLFQRGADVVIASRYEKGAKRENDSFLSLARSLCFRWLTKIILFFVLSMEISDTQCGFKAFRRAVARRLFSALRVHQIKQIKQPFMGAFDVELLYLAKKAGYQVYSVPVRWHLVKSRHLRANEPLLMLISLFKIRWYDMAGKYKNF